MKARPWLAIAFVFAALAGALRPALAQLSFNIPPFASAIKIEEQPITITVSGMVRSAPTAKGNQALRFDLSADLSDLQRQITPILQAQLKTGQSVRRTDRDRESRTVADRADGGFTRGYPLRKMGLREGIR